MERTENHVVIYYENWNKHHEKFYVNNKLHRIEGPAIISYYENGDIEHESYYQNGELER